MFIAWNLSARCLKVSCLYVTLGPVCALGPGVILYIELCLARFDCNTVDHMHIVIYAIVSSGSGVKFLRIRNKKFACQATQLPRKNACDCWCLMFRIARCTP